MRWAAKYVDQHGFDIVWTTEHHFTELAHSGSPGALLGYYSGVTEQVKLGYAVAIVPLHHPMRLAEEFAWLDNLSNGRLIAGISPGWAAYEFSVLGVPIEENRARLVEGFDIVKLALSGESFSYNGKFWQIPEVKMLPQPIQKPLPFVMATSSNESVVNAAKWKVGALLGFRPLETLAEQRKLYIDTCREAGHSEEEINGLLDNMGVLRRIIVADTDEEAEEEALGSAAAPNVMRSRLLTKGGESEPISTATLTRTGARVVGEVEPRETGAYLGVIGGTPETVTRKLLDLKALGVGHVICRFAANRTGGLEPVKEMIRRFCAEVVPAVKAAG
jgi:alkanesulfonate monooxygenase SsuD/methylene tetrahydromethanopterin reductase-like flavin-dependent oxidoreductase (luciferase family)